MRYRPGDRGAVTAEFAAVLPAVLLVLALALGALRLGVEQLRLQGATFDAARLIGRGDAGASAVVVAVNPDARLLIRRANAIVCVDTAAPARLGVLVGLTLAASACALDDVEP
jgi:hypothetical protein